jgi:hypothetical protein
MLGTPATAQAPTGGAAGQQSEADRQAAAKAASDKAAADKAAADKAEAEKKKVPRSYLGKFETEVLAGDGVNELRLPFPSSLLTNLPEATIAWDKPDAWWRDHSCPQEWPMPSKFSAVSKRSDPDKSDQTLVGFEIPAPPCRLPYTQTATVKIDGQITEADSTQSGLKTLYEGKPYVTVFWLPLVITLLAVGLIYPGCAFVYWYMRQQRYERAKAATPAIKWESLTRPPSILESLDPVQITANPWGRGSISKLQIFLFSIIVFALLLFFQLRSGVLAGMSNDVMWLLGISGVGAVGGKIALTRNRRLDFPYWAWLIRHGWLPEPQKDRDIAPRAKWSDLFLDSDTKEFDPYSFQMAVFSIVVAVALARTSLSGLGTFKIPDQLLYLLGLSQVLFIGGKALDTTGYRELQNKLEILRLHEEKLAALNSKQDAKPEDKAAEEKALKEDLADAAQMFAELYRNQLPAGIPQPVKDAIAK